MNALRDFFKRSRGGFKQLRKVHYTEIREGHCSFWIVLPPSFWRSWVMDVDLPGIEIDPDFSYRFLGFVRERGKKPGHHDFPELPPGYVEVRIAHDPNWFEETA